MNYFAKIEDYFNEQLSAIETEIFEQEMAENPSLQKEVEAYLDAQDLFKFTAETLSESEIVAIAASPIAEKTAVIRTLPSSKKPWLVAAATVLVLLIAGGLIWFQPEVQSEIVQVAASVEQEPTIAAIEIASPPLVSPISIKEEIAVTPIAETIAKPTKKIKKTIRKQHLASPAKKTPANAPIKATISSPIALNTNIEATDITTDVVISEGQTLRYKAGNSITLKAGFHAKAGANFIANPIAKNDLEKDIATNVVISNKETIVYKAGNSITLKAGFHAKAGADFIATVKREL